MSTLRTLHEAFEELENRADLAGVTAEEYAPVERPPRRRGVLLAAPVAVAAVVIAAGIAVPVWHGAVSHHTQVATGHAGVPSASPSRHPSPSPTTYQPPTTVAALAARTRVILAGTATITVDRSRSSGCGASTPTLPGQPGGCSGAALGGALTSDGHTGGFDLDVYADPGGSAACDSGTQCTVHHRADGSTLAIGHTTVLGGGVTYEMNYVHADGADILLHLSTESDPKGESPITTTVIPLSQDQMISFVTSDQW